MAAAVTQKQVGQRFAELRKQAGLGQRDVAERIGVSNETLSRLERGQQWTDFGTLSSLASLYGVSWADLMAVEGGGPGGRK